MLITEVIVNLIEDSIKYTGLQANPEIRSLKGSKKG